MSTEATFMTGEKPMIIGVAGGSGSGKTTVTRSICQRFPDQKIFVSEQDYYYEDEGHVAFEDRLQTNYEHPLALDNDLLMDHVQALHQTQAVDKPVDDYKRHTGPDETIRINPQQV